MRRFFWLGLLLCACWPALSVASFDELKAIESTRLIDPTAARQRLSEVAVDSLAADEKEYYRYLDALLMTPFVPLTEVIERYEGLLESVSNADLKIRILGSLINLLGTRKSWEQALQRVEELRNLLRLHPDSEFAPNAYLNMAQLYLKVNMDETALHLINRVFAFNPISPMLLCGAHVSYISIQTELDTESLSLSDFSEAESYCLDAQQDYSIVNLNVWKVKWLMYQQRYEEAETVLITTLMKTEAFPFEGQLIEIYSLFAQVYFATGQPEKAQQYAEKALAQKQQDSFIQPVIDTYDILRQLAEREERYTEAYEYLSIRQQLEKNSYETQLANELAVQKAWFDIDVKQSEIELLDKQNELLKAESLLINERLENSLLALALVSLVLSSLLFWSYRSRKIQTKLRRYAQTDGLTQISNRGYFTECLTDRLESAQKSGAMVGLILLDLDHFKNINDTYGHQVGDWALVQAANAITQGAGEGALVGRLGGEEFGAAIIGVSNTELVRIAENCRTAIENIQTSMSEYQFKLTVSAGVSNSSQTGYKLENLYAAADLALYQSKQYGRNRVYEYSSAMAS